MSGPFEVVRMAPSRDPPFTLAVITVVFNVSLLQRRCWGEKNKEELGGEVLLLELPVLLYSRLPFPLHLLAGLVECYFGE